MNIKTYCKIPFFTDRIKAGFPSPADDYIEKKLDINELLIKNPAASYFLKVSGDSMINAGIFPGDIIIVDRSLDVKNNSIIIASLDGEFTIKRFVKEYGRVYLVPENQKYKRIEIKPEMEFEIWGVAVYSIRNLNNDCTY